MPQSADLNQPPTQSGRGLVRLRVNLAYEGTHFNGWAIQPGQRTVQNEVQNALGVALHLGEPVVLTVAGRTDSGVHARQQVAHCDIPAESNPDFYELTRSLNGLLPNDIRIHSTTFAPAGFDARFSAIARRYSYTLADTYIDPTMRSVRVAQWRRLDVDAMNEASIKLLGLNDFTAYCKPADFGSMIRTLHEYTWTRTDFGVVARVKADAFCHSMVRALIGALVQVGEGKRSIDFPAELLASRERDSTVVTMPAHGLVLEEVYYPADEMLAARQLETRALRAEAELCD